MNFGGELDFISTPETGATFIFTFDVEVNDSVDNQQINQET